MKKLIVLMLLTVFTFPVFANARNTNAPLQNKMQSILNHPYKSYDFSSGKVELESTYDYFGYFSHNGVDYECYGIYPDIYEILAISPTITVSSFTPVHMTTSSPIYTFVTTDIETFLFNGFLMM